MKKLYLDSTNVEDSSTTDNLWVTNHTDAAKVLIYTKIDELILKNPTNRDNNYAIMNFIKTAVSRGRMVPPTIVLESTHKPTRKRFEKDMLEINKMWNEFSA
jgi:hypothetical protein